MIDMTIDDDELVENPTPRVPVLLCLDTSSSMAGGPIEELNDGVAKFFAALKDDDVALHSAEVAVVTFGGAVEVRAGFQSLTTQEIPVFTAGGGTPMGEGLGLALDQLYARKESYRESGVDYYQPWLVVMTDGEPTDCIDAAAKRIRAVVERRKLSVFPIGIGEGANLETLGRISPSRRPLRLKGLHFAEFFEWLSRSVARVSQSTPGEAVPLDLDGMHGWAEV